MNEADHSVYFHNVMLAWMKASLVNVFSPLIHDNLDLWMRRMKVYR